MPRRVLGLYRRIWQTYRAWCPSLLALALIIFLPLGLLDALSLNVEVDTLDGHVGIKLAAIALVVAAITTTGLLGEIFFSGAIALSLTHPHGEGPPPLRELARNIRYGQLILVDLAFVAIVAVGLLLGVVPGVLAFVFLAMSGPVVEIEHRGALSALRRSAHLVRGSFWFVFWVIVPIEIAGDAIGRGLAELVHAVFGHAFLGEWLAEALANVVLSPVFAVGAVLLTVELIAAKEGEAPPLRSAPVPA
ncbi:MAG TPA: hypothetical protein VFJ61_08750 [Solirubrobacterales bacterium]|nr:hypothetical protein [Solirubrobacterales bacterium]